MARIFLALALLAILLLAGNLVYGFVIGDFGESSRRYQRAERELRALEKSDTASLDEIEGARDHLSEVARDLHRQRDRFWPHVWIGIVASLVSLLVNSISVTYFIGTSRWCREVVEAYGMDPALPEKSQALKRRSFPWALTGILMTLAIAALGAASDPYSTIANPAAWVPWHYSAAMIGVVVIAIAFLAQLQAISANHELIQEIVTEAQRLREAAGAESEQQVSGQ